ncbi:disease resistance RPP13-like protein 4 [Phragmites australis]|uniref:disease resistance RPP13-like protein 4 n=1 Tax=Phragmites australis TaxID=29695 RepID=UPI002D7946D9|nr:disease resistance RPP13-like protein 4 [Phragmites australis]
MSVLAQGDATSRGVEEDILVPLLARLTNISTLLDSAAPPPATIRRSPPPPATAASAAGDATLRAPARALLEKVRREMVQLEGVFRRIDDAERRIRYSFDPVEQHLDDALQHEPPDAERIYAELLAVDAGIGAIKTSIREVYNFPCDDGAGGESFTAPPTQLSAPGAGTVMPTKKGEIHRSPEMGNVRSYVGSLKEHLRGCVLCLAAFPEGAVIKKRLLLHWWIGEGFVRSADEGKSCFHELIENKLVVAGPTALCDTVHWCTVRPLIRENLVRIARHKGFLELNAGDVAFARRACLRGGKAQPPEFSAAVRAIYNIGQKYVELGERWFAGKKDLRVLQLGQWREFSTREQIANPMDSHIEISGVERLRDMASCKNLRYLSFRGISRIKSLPDSIGKLRELVVLDLRACHNLEELGQGITKLDRLEYLDLSECHLLVSMPRGLGQLTRLEILKGFVVANSNSRDLCHLNELTKLEKLRKLGIVVGKMAVPTEDEFLKLAELKALESLKISWGVLASVKNGNTKASPRHSVATMKYALPPNLKKLDLHCFPLADFAQWVRPTGVKKLYIRGGRLTTLGYEEGWEAEVLRLRFLSDLQCDHGRLRRLFRKLKPENTEIHECPNFVPGNVVGDL